MILHVTWKLAGVFACTFLEELFENLLGWLFKHAMKSIQSSSVCHSKKNVLDPIRRRRLDQLHKSSSSWVKALNSKPFEVSELASQIINKCLVLSKPIKSGKLFLLGWFLPLKHLNLLLQLLFDEIAFLLVQQMHVFEARFIAIDRSKPIFKFLDSIRTVILIRPFPSQIPHDYILAKLLAWVTKGRRSDLRFRDSSMK